MMCGYFQSVPAEYELIRAGNQVDSPPGRDR